MLNTRVKGSFPNGYTRTSWVVSVCIKVLPACVENATAALRCKRIPMFPSVVKVESDGGVLCNWVGARNEHTMDNATCYSGSISENLIYEFNFGVGVAQWQFFLDLMWGTMVGGGVRSLTGSPDAYLMEDQCVCAMLVTKDPSLTGLSIISPGISLQLDRSSSKVHSWTLPGESKIKKLLILVQSTFKFRQGVELTAKRKCNGVFTPRWSPFHTKAIAGKFPRTL